MYKKFGVTVTITQEGSAGSTTTPLVVVARDARDAEAVAEKAAGPNALAETLRELTDDEAREYALDLQAHGTSIQRSWPLRPPALGRVEAGGGSMNPITDH